MKTITKEDLLKLRPCCGGHQLRRVAGERTHWSALDILARKGVPQEDRLWVVLREELIDGRLLYKFAKRTARRRLKELKPILTRQSWVAIKRTPRTLIRQSDHIRCKDYVIFVRGYYDLDDGEYKRQVIDPSENPVQNKGER